MSVNQTGPESEPTRRDFLYIATGAMGAVGVAAAAWPFIDQMNPDASTRALASIEVDVSSIEEGQAITVKWRGKPVFIRNRTAEGDRGGEGRAARRTEGSGRAQRQSASRPRQRPTTTAPAAKARKTGW